MASWFKCSFQRAFFSFYLVILALVMFPGNVAASEDKNQVRPKEAASDSSINSADGMPDKEGGMEARDKVSEEEGRRLLAVARETIERALFGAGKNDALDQALPAKFHERRGTFVTLTKDGNLRGCIGHIVPQENLIEGIRVNAINAAFRDPRFRPVSEDEWDRIKIEVSILTDPKPVAYKNSKDLLDKLRPGIDGVILKKGYHQATFLPQVWEQLKRKEDFLTHLCLKAGLEGKAWKGLDLEVSTYQVQAFEE